MKKAATYPAGNSPARRSKFPARLDKFPVRRNKIPCSDFKPAGMHGKEWSNYFSLGMHVFGDA
jgi:hypothetical protein